MKHLIILSVSGALGTLMRYGIITWIGTGTKGFPWATLSVNVIGSALMGVCYVLIIEKGVMPEAFRPYIMTAFLGALTTFSAFSLEMFQFIEGGQFLHAMIYTLASVLSCVLVLAASVWLVRHAV